MGSTRDAQAVMPETGRRALLIKEGGDNAASFIGSGRLCKTDSITDKIFG
ncbi:hypothetical protein [Erwinia pyrifoliae]|uniref:Uncharacterized protein n=1 Tax=Erwinia pyrifoliae TaxID=79967 RepID=A0ABY5X7C3_ERWPY|nr:hypothetical protein [Erwinia pyrifoliae]MCT2387467.1 hypothetical protein [Erwinia pyrifoliae]MCU8585722.1 hypothetical protein [Erwinia pyrifoliae]UWS28983.1 hypothetical protein NYP81_13775 [Erwinia pyrifoliae]UWS33283.1 hypothetical protein NYP84_17130 [Erwinia pyrifoliae]UXK11975.1 hypothetical protein NYP80_17095 [Erwinia pyrifoliae]